MAKIQRQERFSEAVQMGEGIAAFSALWLSCEIFGMEGNDIPCFLNQEIVFVLGDSFLHASVESSGVCVLVTEKLACESPPLNRLLLKEKRVILTLS